ncbi:MAG TPA: TIGR03862 family flavoprotein, partial [Burkholderiaceae bacterium]
QGAPQDRTLRFATPDGEVALAFDAVVLALGGASWPRLGSDGAWVLSLIEAGAAVAPLQPSNCGFDVAGGWSEYFRSRHAGAPLKNVALTVSGDGAAPAAQIGECVVTETGIEGSLVYALSASIRDRIAQGGSLTVRLDLLPALEATRVAAEVARPRGSRSLATHLKSRLGLAGVKAALLHECLSREQIADPRRLAEAIKAVPLTLAAARPVAEAISTAGGVRFESLRDDLMLHDCPGVFCAGEMLDWEAPTGGYLLTACFASGVAAGLGVLAMLTHGADAR